MAGIPMESSGRRAASAGELPGARTQLVIALAALLARVIYILGMRGSPYFDHPIIDAFTYDQAAQSIARGLGHPDPVFWQPPGYPFFLGGVYAAFGRDLLAVRWVQAGLGALSALLCARVGSLAFDNRTGRAAGFVAALYPLLFYFDGELLPPTLTIVLLLAGLELALRAVRSGGWRWLASGLALGLAATVTATSLLAGAVVAGFARRSAPLVVLGVALAVAPVTLHNVVKGHEGVLISSNGGINLYLGNNPDYERTVAIRPDREWDSLTKQPLLAGLTSQSARSGYFVHRVIEWARQDPAAFARLQLHKVRLLLGGDEILRNQAIYPSRARSPLLAALLWKIPGLAFPWGLLAPLAVVGIVFRWRRSPLLAAFLLAAAAGVVAFFVTARYRTPMVPVMILFAVEAVRWFIAEASGRRRGLAVALFTIGFLVSNLGQGTMAGAMNADAEYSLAVQLAAEGRVGEAESLYRSAIRQRPDYPEAWLNLGQLHQQAGRLTEAEAEFTRAMQLDPDDPTAVADLAVVQAQRGRAGQAVPLFAQALRMRPAMPTAVRNLGLLADRLEARRREIGNGAPDDTLLEAWGLLYRATGDSGRLESFLRGCEQRGDLSRAVAMAREALAAAPGRPALEYALGRLLVLSGAREAGISMLRTAVAGGDPEVRRKLEAAPELDNVRRAVLGSSGR